eukprot:TRINITY_DN9128_c0_g1_i7.p1 TRINITY_DN9128_c0_g1~~TRINITY_DN9128_c0_g1_i7.p1  ORF type:complete len:167 (+),score=6.06 TRINITY_DN9128_c0_g1_i7:129-629(+)
MFKLFGGRRPSTSEIERARQTAVTMPCMSGVAETEAAVQVWPRLTNNQAMWILTERSKQRRQEAASDMALCYQLVLLEHSLSFPSFLSPLLVQFSCHSHNPSLAPLSLQHAHTLRLLLDQLAAVRLPAQTQTSQTQTSQTQTSQTQSAQAEPLASSSQETSSCTIQ